ncbi:uncharacterized protein LOC124887090 [Capsicum annuum]|uniref:uncharacterized protein LOC124887090 n=1 Tax=Capsicum annuum TaxID=4072 RepID=UPI001FB07786|nr:uncharacterized protein LOC124887090 [Capsicum annuum]
MDLLAKNLLSGKTDMVKAVDAQGTISAGADAEANYVIVEKEVSVDESEGRNPVKSEKVNGFINMSEKEDDKKRKWYGNKLPRTPPPFLQRLKNKKNNEKFSKFMAKKKVSCEMVENLHHCSAVSSQSLVQKKPDPGAFTILCIVGPVKFEKALCDLGANRSIKRPMGILHDVLVKVADFILPANFVVLDYDVDFKVPIILGRTLLATRRVLVNLELNELNF